MNVSSIIRQQFSEIDAQIATMILNNNGGIVPDFVTDEYADAVFLVSSPSFNESILGLKAITSLRTAVAALHLSEPQSNNEQINLLLDLLETLDELHAECSPDFIDGITAGYHQHIQDYLEDMTEVDLHELAQTPDALEELIRQTEEHSLVLEILLIENYQTEETDNILASSIISPLHNVEALLDTEEATGVNLLYLSDELIQPSLFLFTPYKEGLKIVA